MESEFSHHAVITVLKESTCFFSNQINWQRQLILSWVNGSSIHTVLINAFSYARSNCLPTLRLLCTLMEIGIKAFCLIVYQQRFQPVSEIQNKLMTVQGITRILINHFTVIPIRFARKIALQSVQRFFSALNFILRKSANLDAKKNNKFKILIPLAFEID